MMTSQKRVLIALYNMGGPGSSAEVSPFLSELFNDPDLLDIPLGRWLQSFVANKIISKRLSEVIARYALMGGGSPQLPITQRVAQSLEERLLSSSGASLFCAEHDTSTHTPYRLLGVTPLYRYSEPRAHSVLQRCVDLNADELWLVSQYPHCARATTGTSLREIGLEQAGNTPFSNVTVRTLSNYYDNPDFIDMWTRRVGDHWKKNTATKKHLVISAHNLPMRYVAQGDPYPQQIRKTAIEVTRRLGLHEGVHWSLCWQSAVGPVQWMKPTTDETIERLCRDGAQSLIIWPVAFVSDHIETLVEVDAEYADMAKKLGCKSFERVANLNADEDFIQLMSLLVGQAAQDLCVYPATPLLRDLHNQPAGPYCSAQPAGCLCGNYYLSGRSQMTRGTRFARVEARTPESLPTKGSTPT